MLTDKQKINRLEMIIDSFIYNLKQNESEWYYMIERDDFEEIERDYEHYEKEKRSSRNE